MTAPSPRGDMVSDHGSSVFGGGDRDSSQPYLETWQPIETAPLGRLLIAYKDSAGNDVVEIATNLHREGWFAVGYYTRRILPTHWRPLPLPPATDASVPDAGAVTDGIKE